MTSGSVQSPYSPVPHRLLAYAADSFVILFMNFAGYVFGGIIARLLADPALADADHQFLQQLGSGFGWLFWGGATWFLNYGVLQGMTGASIGKHYFNLRVVRRDGAPLTIRGSLARSAAYLISVLPVYLGFAMLLWDSERRALHDRICSTVVVRKGAAYPPAVSGDAGSPRFDDEISPTQRAA